MIKKREHFVTCGQMKILERRADENGLSYYQMMENAGTCAAEMIMAKYDADRADNALNPEKAARQSAEGFKVAEQMTAGSTVHDIKDKASADGTDRVLVFCGKGNNGGDGFVVARKLQEAGFEVTVILVDGEPVTEDSITNMELIRDNIRIMNMKTDERLLLNLRVAPEIIVDAVYGTGFRGELSGNGLKAAIFINKLHETKGARVVSLDIPSGLGGDMTNIKDLDKNSVRADYTITFHARKPVHLQSFAADYCGETAVADIGIDEQRLWNIEV